jgi:hypothetical protein
MIKRDRERERYVRCPRERKEERGKRSREQQNLKAASRGEGEVQMWWGGGFLLDRAVEVAAAPLKQAQMN